MLPPEPGNYQSQLAPMPNAPIANTSTNPLVQAILRAMQAGPFSGALGRGAVRPGPGPSGRTDVGGDVLRGAPNSIPMPTGFEWGGQRWGANDFSKFAGWLSNHGIAVSQFAKAHPGAFATFNIDPGIRNLIMGMPPTAAATMPHA